jgi:capsular polysaccharide transport system permease protein
MAGESIYNGVRVSDSGTMPPARRDLIAFTNQLRVVFALTLREVLTRYGRHNIGFIWMFAEPMLFTLGVTTLWNLMPHSVTDGVSVTAFVLSGYSTVLLWRNMPNRCIGAVTPNSGLMYHRQVKVLDIYISRILVEAVGATASLCLLTVVLSAMQLIDFPVDILKVLCGWFLLAGYAFSLSILVGALSECTEIVERVFHIFQYLMIPLSGAFFTVESVPSELRGFVLLNPTVHCTELFREGFFGNRGYWVYDVAYVLVVTMMLALVGLLQLRRVGGKSEGF